MCRHSPRPDITCRAKRWKQKAVSGWVNSTEIEWVTIRNGTTWYYIMQLVFRFSKRIYDLLFKITSKNSRKNRVLRQRVVQKLTISQKKKYSPTFCLIPTHQKTGLEEQTWSLRSFTTWVHATQEWFNMAGGRPDFAFHTPFSTGTFFFWISSTYVSTKIDWLFDAGSVSRRSMTSLPRARTSTC